MSETTGYGFFSSVKTGFVEGVGEEESIRQSILLALSTEQGERALSPDYGSRLSQFIFQKPQDSILREMEAEIRRCLSSSEPRIVVDEVRLKMLSDSRRIEAFVRYRIKTKGQLVSLQIPLQMSPFL